jgi:RNase P subunit RPR2
MRGANEAAFKVSVRTNTLRMLIQECPKCRRFFTAANSIEERGTDSGLVIILCECGYFAEFQDNNTN